MPLLQGEGWSDNHDMIIIFLLTILTKSFALGLVLSLKVFTTREWPVP